MKHEIGKNITERGQTYYRSGKPIGQDPHGYWLPDQGFYEDCQVLQSRLGEWPNNWWSAGRVFLNSLLCAKGYSFHVRASGASLARTSTLLDDLFSYRSIKRLPRTASLPGTTVGPFQRIERNARYAFYPCWHIGMPSTSCYARALRVVRTVGFSRRPNLEIGVRVHPALVRAPCLGVRRSALSGSLHQTVPVLSVAPSGITPYST
jgi:hypothetical protein